MTHSNPLPAVVAFVRVAHHGSFTRAAAELDVSTSALSQSVRALEARLGVRLLNRTTRRVGLTEHGQRFLQRVAPGLQQIDAAFADLDFLRDRPAGTLRINLPRVAAEQLICPHLPGFLARYPDVAVELYAERSFADIVAGGFDAGVRLGESLARDMVAVPVGPMQRQAIVATPDYFARHGVPQSPAELVGQDCIRWRRSDGRIRPWEFTRDGRDFEVEVEGRLVVNDSAMGLAALRRGAGLGQVFEWEIAAEVADGRLRRVLDPWQVPFAGWHLYYPARERMAPKLRVFIDYLRECWDHASPPDGQRRRAAMAGPAGRTGSVVAVHGTNHRQPGAYGGRPAGIGCVRRPAPLPRAHEIAMDTLPSLYISHGSPMTALQPGRVGQRLAELAATLPRPRAIVLASAHWLARRPLVGAAARPQTIHDFGGFPAPLYAIEYPAPGEPALARQVHSLLEQAGLQPQLDPQRGLDHGAWVPLRLLYPQADIPVVPVSIQPGLGPAHQLALGRALAPLREQGVLLVGSGSITHNLHDVHAGYDAQREAPYLRPFIGWMEQRLRADDLPALLDYRRQAPGAERAHPSDEHLLPLYFAMGAAGGEALGARRIDAGIDMGILAMDIYRFDGGA